jgi:hypothetical protein
MRGNRAAVIENVFARCAGIQDCVGDLKQRRCVINAPARTCRVAGDGAIGNVQRRVDVVAVVDTAPLVPAELPLMVLFTMLT